MRLVVDNQRCEAHGACAMVDEELFPVDDDGYSLLSSGVDVPDGRLATARAGVDACPLRALTLE